MRTRFGPAKPVVVVADDDPDIRRLLSHVLSEAGYDVTTAMDLYEAMDLVRAPGVAAVILDMLFVNSGGRSGLDLLQFIRSQPHLKDLGVIVITGFSLNHTVVTQINAHRAELWHKPVDPIDLVQRVHHLVHH
jgi:DNA-binding response OmpR family regulator